MPKKRKKQSQAQKEYKKEQQRIKRFIRRAQGRGYIFPDDVLPPMPKRITKASVQKLKKIRPEQLYAKAHYTDYDTGEAISGTIRRKQERSQVAIRSAITRQRKRDELETKLLRREIEEYRERKKKQEQQQISEDYTDYDTDFQAPPTSQNPPPSMDIVDKIHDAIDELPDIVYAGKKQTFVEPYKNMLHSLLNDRVDLAESVGQLTQYIEFLQQQQEQIFEAMEVSKMSSEQNTIYTSLTRVANILKAATLSPAESKEFEDYLQFYEDYELPV